MKITSMGILVMSLFRAFANVACMIGFSFKKKFL